jgi:RHS repeat-associated protein
VLALRTNTPSTCWGPLSTTEPPVGAPIDANGNLTADGTRSFEWDARNQLVAVTIGTHRSEFTYDGEQRRVRVVEKENGVTQSDTKVIWCEAIICEERAADGATVTRRAFGQGEQIAGTPQFFARDHIGSVREVADATGTLLARYEFDPWGRRTITAGTDVTPVGFTGHRTHTASGLSLALYRTYDAAMGRWASEDPLGFADGPNLYAYAADSPISNLDRLGLLTVRNNIRERVVDQKDIPTTAVAMTRVSAAFTCACRCENGSWKLEGILMLYGEMLLPRRVTRRPAADPTVRDTASARAHEYAWHIDPAINAVRALVEPYENRADASEGECQGACSQVRPLAVKRFYDTLRSTQRQEEGRR